jgi:hypothetical protein
MKYKLSHFAIPMESTVRRRRAFCHAAIPSAVVPVHRLLNVLPLPLNTMIRTLLMMLPPRSLAPLAQPYRGSYMLVMKEL